MGGELNQWRDCGKMEKQSTGNQRPRAVFMAFGTKGDVYPIAAIAAAFASDQTQYCAFFISHSAHQNLGEDLGAKNVKFLPISTPPVLSCQHYQETPGCTEIPFSLQKKMISSEHRRGCLTTMEMIFGDGPSLQGDFIVINFFALEGWSLAELFHIRCAVAAPYVVTYSAPASFDRHFNKELPLLYKCLQEAPMDKVCWKDVIHWMWPLFTEDWGAFRSDLNLSPLPFTDPVTGLPILSDWPKSPLLLYGFSKEVVECPGYWPSNVRVCGFWFLPMEWQFSCIGCRKILVPNCPGHQHAKNELCSTHADLLSFLNISNSDLPIFIGLSSVGSMGFLNNPRAFLHVLQAAVEITNRRYILFSAGYEPLDDAINELFGASSRTNQKRCSEGILLFNNHLFCFSGSMPYSWLFQKCAVAIHHGGSGSTAAALLAGVPQVVCPFMLDQFYWAERMFWLGVAPEPLHKDHLLPDKDDDISILRAANTLSKAIKSALSPDRKAHAADIAKRICSEDGVGEAVKILKEEIVNN